MGRNDKEIHVEIKEDFVKAFLKENVLKRLKNEDRIIIQNSLKSLTL